MGGATFAIGLLPTYAQVGMLAPVLLVLLRIAQGTALGGEIWRRGHLCGRACSQQSARSGDRMDPVVGVVRPAGGAADHLATRSWLGEEAFGQWGWRIPFLMSVILLAISVWMRMKLAESPHFAKLQEDGEVSKTPLREAFANRDGLRRVAIAFFGIMCAQGAVWYFSFFYMQVFLEKSLGVPGTTKDLLLIIMTVVSAPLYVFFGWLSDRVGRKPVMLAGMLLALALYFPGSHLIAQAGNPALVTAQKATPVTSRPICEVLGSVRSTGTPNSRAPATSPRAPWSAAAFPIRPAPRRKARQSCRRPNVAPITSGEAGRGGIERSKPVGRSDQCRAGRRGLSHFRRSGPDRHAAAGRGAGAIRGRGDGALRPQAAALVEMFQPVSAIRRCPYPTMSAPAGSAGSSRHQFRNRRVDRQYLCGAWYRSPSRHCPLWTIFFLKETHGKPLEEC